MSDEKQTFLQKFKNSFQVTSFKELHMINGDLAELMEVEYKKRWSDVDSQLIMELFLDDKMSEQEKKDIVTGKTEWERLKGR